MEKNGSQTLYFTWKNKTENIPLFFTLSSTAHLFQVRNYFFKQKNLTAHQNSSLQLWLGGLYKLLQWNALNTNQH